MQFNNQDVKVGADPEVLLVKGGAFVSAHNLIQGSKNEPYPVQDGAIQVDGMALEFNINPANTLAEFTHNIESVYKQLREQVPPDFEFSDQCTAHFDINYFEQRSMDETVMGCEVDFNAYSQEANKKPDEALPIRTAGGHIHIGWREAGFMNEEHIENCENVTKMCDMFLGLPSLFFDTDTERREMYGAAGCYRPKLYGVEYRTLSNAWINSKELTMFVYNNIELMMSREDEWDQILKDSDTAQAAINASDLNTAQELMKKFNIPMFGG